MSDSLSIIIRALLSEKTSTDIQTQLKEIESKLKPLNLKASITSDIQTTEKQITSSLDKIEKKFKAVKSLSNFNISGKMQVLDTSQLDKASQVYTQMENKVGGITKKTNEWTDSLGRTVKEIQYFKDGADKAYKTTTETADNYKKLAETMAKVRERGNQTTQNDTAKDLQKRTEASNKFLEQDHINEKKRKQEASDFARKLTREEEQERLKNTTNTQKQIERIINGSNETILQKQKRMLKSEDSGHSNEQMWQKLLLENEVKEKKITAEQAKQNQLIREKIALYQKELAIKNQNLKTTYGNSYNSTGMTSIISSANNLNASDYKTVTELNKATKQLDLEVAKSTAGMKELRKQASLTMDKSDGFFTTLTKDFSKMVAWTVVGTAIFGTFRQLKLGISYISDLDNSLNEVRIVTGKTQVEVQKLADSYNDLAKKMRVTTAELTSVGADLYRQGLNDSQVEERMKRIVQYAKISSIDLDTANKIITATTNATGESVEKVINIFSQLGDLTAAGPEEIGESLQRVASAAENSNISLEKSASWIATISSITRESASTIGRSLDFGAIAA